MVGLCRTSQGRQTNHEVDEPCYPPVWADKSFGWLFLSLRTIILTMTRRSRNLPFNHSNSRRLAQLDGGRA